MDGGNSSRPRRHATRRNSFPLLANIALHAWRRWWKKPFRKPGGWPVTEALDASGDPLCDDFVVLHEDSTSSDVARRSLRTG